MRNNKGSISKVSSFKMSQKLMLLLSLVLIASLTVLLPGCSKAEETASSTAGSAEVTGLANPVVEAPNPEAVNEQLGLSLMIPLEASVITCAVIDDSLGEVVFSYENVTYTYRGMKSTQIEDISGLFYDFDTLKELQIAGFDAIIEFTQTEAGSIRWFDNSNKIVYSVSVESGATEELLTTIAEMLITEQAWDQ